MGHARCDSPKCGTCLLGKQHKTANPAKHVRDKAPGELKKDVLQPVLTDLTIGLPRILRFAPVL